MWRFLMNVLAGCVFISWALPASAFPTRWAVNSHWYEAVVVAGEITWQQAQDAAAARGGYLATLTSEVEHDFVYGLVSNPACWHGTSGPWLGGYQPPGALEPSGGWAWITGEPWSYTRWWPDGQPDDAGGVEDYLDFEGGPNQSVHPGGWWNDLKLAAPGPRAYVIEWNAQPGSPPACWPTNGHCYQVVVVPGPIAWQQARDEAVARGGHLATITSQEEHEFVYGLASDPAYWNGTSGPWLGGYQPAGSPEPGGGWTWVTDEAWGYTRWWPDGQPDDAGGVEDYMNFEGGPNQAVYPGGWWNDLMNAAPGPRAYVIEWEVLATPAHQSTWGGIKTRYR
jgi:hypothetical protein